jgi:hypothetical protein
MRSASSLAQVSLPIPKPCQIAARAFTAQLTMTSARLDDSVMSAGSDDLQEKVIELARATEAPQESFLMRRLPLDDPDQVQSVIDGLMLSLISYCYHRHPRGENVHEVMEMLEQVKPGSPEAAELELRADDAAALQIPFIVTLNKLVEDYYHIRRRLEARLRAEE